MAEVENGVRLEDGSLGDNVTKSCHLNAAIKVQKVYRSYRTRRMLADSVVVAEELWWQVIDSVRLNRSTISFFDFLKPETPASRWIRIGSNASRVGRGLSVDAKAQKLAFQHWIEAIDSRHRYGHSLHLYYDEWCKTNAGDPFFFWLDIGEGREVDLKQCPRSKLRQQCIKYLGPQERQHFEYVVVDGIILNKLTGEPLDTRGGSPGSKFIFVICTSRRLYAGEKKKGLFHHSSFLAGGATLAAGRLVAEDGVLKCISAYSGHYKPTDDSLNCFLSLLKENGVNLDDVRILKRNEDYENGDHNKSIKDTEVNGLVKLSNSNLDKEEEIQSSVYHTELKAEYKRTLSGGLQSPKPDVSKTAIMQRINSKTAANSYQLGHQLPAKWSTGAGPRIGCISDYPHELRLQALELTMHSSRPRVPSLSTTPSSPILVSPNAITSAPVDVIKRS